MQLCLLAKLLQILTAIFPEIKRLSSFCFSVSKCPVSGHKCLAPASFVEKFEDRVFVIRGESSGGRNSSRRRGISFTGKGRGIGSSRSSGYGDQRQITQRQQDSTEFNSWSQGRGGPRQFEGSMGGQRQYGAQRFNRGSLPNVQCYNFERASSSSQSDQNSSCYGNLFMIHDGVECENSSIWILDSGCSSHVPRNNELFYQLNAILSHKV